MDKQKLEKEILEKLKEILDPELGIDIVRLGLILQIEIGEWENTFNVFEEIKVTMTLTSIMCPFADKIIEDVEEKVNSLNIGEAKVELDFSKPWEPSQELKLELGIC